MRVHVQLLAVYLLATACGMADPPIITDYANGHLSFSNSMAPGYHSLEWASSLTGEWSRTWLFLKDRPARLGVSRVEVPMFYRVVWHPTAGVIVIPGIPPTPVTEKPAGSLVGTGVANLHQYSGMLPLLPVAAGSLTIHCQGFNFTDDGKGVLVCLLCPEP